MATTHLRSLSVGNPRPVARDDMSECRWRDGHLTHRSRRAARPRPLSPPSARTASQTLYPVQPPVPPFPFPAIPLFGATGRLQTTTSPAWTCAAFLCVSLILFACGRGHRQLLFRRVFVWAPCRESGGRCEENGGVLFEVVVVVHLEGAAVPSCARLWKLLRFVGERWVERYVEEA